MFTSLILVQNYYEVVVFSIIFYTILRCLTLTDRDCISILELCNRWSVFKHDGMPGDKLVAALILSHDLPIYILEEGNYHVDKEGSFFDLSNSKMDYDEESDNFNDILTKIYSGKIDKIESWYVIPWSDIHKVERKIGVHECIECGVNKIYKDKELKPDYRSIIASLKDDISKKDKEIKKLNEKYIELGKTLFMLSDEYKRLKSLSQPQIIDGLKESLKQERQEKDNLRAENQNLKSILSKGGAEKIAEFFEQYPICRRIKDLYMSGLNRNEVRAELAEKYCSAAITGLAGEPPSQAAIGLLTQDDERIKTKQTLQKSVQRAVQTHKKKMS